MMSNEKYVAYVGTYTHGTSVGIHLYDMDVEEGAMTERKMIPINNASHLTISADGRFLYSIADEGVVAFRILPDGDLEMINCMGIGGMRGCFVEVDKQNRYLFVAGYYDGRVSMMRLREDGGIDGIADGIFHQGMGRNIAQRSSRPHVNCVILTPGQQNYVCAVDGGLDHVKIYKVDYDAGKMHFADALRCPLDSAPRSMHFSRDGRFAYVVCELLNTVEVYRFTCTPKGPEFEHIQSEPTLHADKGSNGAAVGMDMSDDGKYLFCCNSGEDSVTIFEVDQETGLLDYLCWNKISGDFPKTVGIFPDGKHFVSLNHDSDELRVFSMNYEKKYFLLKGRPLKIDTPSCIRIHKLDE